MQKSEKKFAYIKIFSYLCTRFSGCSCPKCATAIKNMSMFQAVVACEGRGGASLQKEQAESGRALFFSSTKVQLFFDMCKYRFEFFRIL